jgi:hypothetical protein
MSASASHYQHLCCKCTCTYFYACLYVCKRSTGPASRISHCRQYTCTYFTQSTSPALSCFRMCELPLHHQSTSPVLSCFYACPYVYKRSRGPGAMHQPLPAARILRNQLPPLSLVVECVSCRYTINQLPPFSLVTRVCMCVNARGNLEPRISHCSSSICELGRPSETRGTLTLNAPLNTTHTHTHTHTKINMHTHTHNGGGQAKKGPHNRMRGEPHHSSSSKRRSSSLTNTCTE